MSSFYMRRILRAVAVLLALIWILFKIFTKSEIMPVSSMKGAFKVWYEQHLKPVDYSIKAFISAIVLVALIFFVIPFAMDIPDMISGNFQIVRGTVLTKAYAAKTSERVVKVQDMNTGETISVRVNYTAADEGDYVEVKYLEHSKEGIVTKHTKKK